MKRFESSIRNTTLALIASFAGSSLLLACSAETSASAQVIRSKATKKSDIPSCKLYGKSGPLEIKPTQKQLHTILDRLKVDETELNERGKLVGVDCKEGYKAGEIFSFPYLHVDSYRENCIAVGVNTGSPETPPNNNQTYKIMAAICIGASPTPASTQV